MEKFKNLEEIINLCTKELYIGDRNIHATLGFEELKELQNLLNNERVLERHAGMLINKTKEQEKIIGLMAEELERRLYVFENKKTDEIIEHFRKKAKGE